ncbi:uncharacterized protein LOC133310812 [Gastrolobium bilobum]|uniref:uncharacterized protein LOC133310812 n=1 Tax=Gastrolobium bilobum TaxID=150636 RepID=UPI002AB14362|nr:uncharacterized protein LOC133310812 [Gastrolobium bilobum]
MGKNRKKKPSTIVQGVTAAAEDVEVSPTVQVPSPSSILPVADQVFDENLQPEDLSSELSVTLGVDDSVTEKVEGNSNGAGESKIQQPILPIAPWANLFKDNRSENKGHQWSDEIEPSSSDDKLIVELGDVQAIDETIGFCLIGYIAGKFSGLKALLNVCRKWGVKYSYSPHSSGWLIFRFLTEEDMNKVLQIRLRNLPLELWRKKALGKILSKIGKPLRTDHLIATTGSISFAHALVEVDASKDLTQVVFIQLPDGNVIKQPVEYENEPTFCSYCKTIGHEMGSCTYAPKTKGSVEAPKKTEAVLQPALEALDQPFGKTLTEGQIHLPLGTPLTVTNGGFTVVSSKSKRKKLRATVRKLQSTKLPGRSFKTVKKLVQVYDFPPIMNVAASAPNIADGKSKLPLSPSICPISSPANKSL